MRRHAGDLPSPLLSSALVTSHDATVAYWDGSEEAGLRRPGLKPDSDYLDQVRPQTRALILDCLLRQVFVVTGSQAAGTAELTVGGARVAAITRPAPDYFASQLQWLRAYSDLRSDRLAEIYQQSGDILSFFGALAHLDTGRRKYTLTLMEVVRSAAVHVETLMKFYCRQQRPYDFSMQVQPMIQTPDHSAFPSGHAMEAFALATLLTRLARGEGARAAVRDFRLPFVLAHRIATNRTVAGVHFPVDSRAGAFVGCLLGEAFAALASGARPGGGQLAIRPDENPDFTLAQLHADLPPPGGGRAARHEVVAWFWARALAEWQ
ncbi:MAG: phosphatase PAP2 family protein [Rhodobacteraceae bacterium]|nr:phosphatase PAP2 family protein [Paracoccaceae bacterium]